MSVPLPMIEPALAPVAATRGDGVRLTDPFGRGVGYLRLSLTKACSMRCVYCRPQFLDHPRGEAMLTCEEIQRLVRHLADRHGLHKVRLTGGDPTSRPDLTRIIHAVGRTAGVTDLCMTTNGLTLANRAGEYATAGLKRINISLDSLDRERFTRMTGVDGLERVLRGIAAAKQAGLAPIKLNAVILRDENENELPQLLRFAAEGGMQLRLIELMPMGPLASQWEQRYVPEAVMRQHLESIVTGWQPITQGHDAARRYRVRFKDGLEAVVGFITPMSCNFCAECNRIRIAADGAIFPCLMDEPRGSILPALRPRFDGDQLDAILAESLTHKRAEHPHDGYATMTHIGG